jgi:hypothetical protein
MRHANNDGSLNIIAEDSNVASVGASKECQRTYLSMYELPIHERHR